MNIQYRIKHNIATLLSREWLSFLKYCVVGVINTSANYFFFCAYIYLGAHYAIAGFLALITGILFNYFATRRFVFNGPTKVQTFLRYIVTYGLLYIISLVIAYLLIDVVGFSPYFAGFISLPINALISYALLRIIVFR